MASETYERIANPASFHDEGHGFDLFGFHPPTLAKAVATTAPIYDRYFRVDSMDAEEIPESGPAIVIANHAGVLPVDAGILCVDILRHTRRIPRPIMDHFVPRLPLVSTYFARVGGVSGTRANVRTLLERGELLVIFPEGVSGVAKPFRERYQLQHWSVGFAELAIRYRATVIPTAIIGSEESWPVLVKLRGLKLFGAPYLPIPATPLPLPTRYRIRYGTPIHFDAKPADADDPAVVARAAAQAREAVQQLIADARAARRGVFR